MALANLLPAVAKAAFGSSPLGLAAGVLGAVGGLGGRKRHRRRRARLTSGELQELAMIKSTLGRTAAANALPFYMGRGR